MTEHEAALATYFGLSAHSHEAAVLKVLIDLGCQVVGADEGSLLVYDETQEDLVIAMTTAGAPEDAAALLGKRVPLGAGETGMAAATHEVQIGTPSYDLGGGPSGGGGPRDVAWVLAAPMLVGAKLIGVITAVTFDAERRFTADHARLYGSVASVAAVVVQQHQRIASLETLAEKGLSAVDGGGVDPTITRIVAAVRGLARTSDLERVARLLEAVEALTGAGGDA